jgi:hypothetical protein
MRCGDEEGPLDRICRALNLSAIDLPARRRKNVADICGERRGLRITTDRCNLDRVSRYRT